MAKYKVLRSAAHNFGHSFVSDMNLGAHDFVPCYLLRAARASGATELRVDLRTGAASPRELCPPEVLESVAVYCRNFGAHVQRSGAALDMVSAAEMRVQVVWPPGGVSPAGAVRGYLQCEVEITDDRGRKHHGATTAEWTCPLDRLPW